MNNSRPVLAATLLGLLWATCLLATGCAGADGNARVLARETLVQVTEYEDAVRSMNRIMAKQYEADARALNDVRSGISGDLAESELAELAGDLADVAADIDEDLRVRDFRQFIADALQSSRAIDARSAEARRVLAEETEARLATLQVQEKQLKAVRAKLERLQVPQTLEEDIDRFKPLFDEGRKAIEEIKKAEAARATTGGTGPTEQ